jgi:hypothetical protein
MRRRKAYVLGAAAPDRMLEHFADLASLQVSQLLPPKLGTLLIPRKHAQ